MLIGRQVCFLADDRANRIDRHQAADAEGQAQAGRTASPISWQLGVLRRKDVRDVHMNVSCVSMSGRRHALVLVRQRP